MVTKPIRSFALITSLVFLLSLSFSNESKAQLGDAGTIMQSGLGDANLLFKEYLTPLGNSFGAGLNTGWNHQARPHRGLPIPGFSLSIRTAVTIVPDSDLLFDLLNAGFTNIEPSTAMTQASTFTGPDAGTPVSVFARDVVMPDGSTQDIELANFNLPKGVDFQYLPSAMVQLGIGVFKDTEIGVRYLPAFEIGDNIPEIGLFGLNVKHGINQWIPGGGLLPVSIAVQGGFTNFDINTSFDVQPDAVTNENTTQESINSFAATHWSDQALEVNANAWNVNAIVGRNLPFVGFYAGVGYEGSTFSVVTKGNYPLLSPAPTLDNPQENVLTSTPTDPIDFEIEGKNNIRGIVGAQISLGPLKINAEYTQAVYSTINVGIAVSIR